MEITSHFECKQTRASHNHFHCVKAQDQYQRILNASINPGNRLALSLLTPSVVISTSHRRNATLKCKYWSERQPRNINIVLTNSCSTKQRISSSILPSVQWGITFAYPENIYEIFKRASKIMYFSYIVTKVYSEYFKHRRQWE